MELFNICKNLDKNKDGILSKEDLKKAFKESNYNISAEEVGSVFDVIDTDKDQKISYTQFISAAINKKELLDQ